MDFTAPNLVTNPIQPNKTMSTTHDSPHDDDSLGALTKPKISFWRRLGGGSLTISLIVHAILLAIGAVLVVAVIHNEPDKDVEFDGRTKGGGGGKASAAKQSVKAAASRVSAKGLQSSISLPSPEMSSNMSSLGSIGGSGLGGGLGSGGGTGGGFGTGNGPGVGPGTGPGMGGTGNPFGALNPNAGALVGTLYDMKQTSDRQPTNMTPDEFRVFLRDYLANGWKDSDLEKYYKAPNRVYQTKIQIPLIGAEKAPAAFNANEVQASRWMVVYRGSVIAPKSGRFRFVGGADDVLVVRLNGKNVFDHGWTVATVNMGHGTAAAALRGQNQDRDVTRFVKKNYPMPEDLKFYQYTTTANYNKSRGGLAVGPEFSVTAGKSYPIDILISEIPGGSFCASLLIEEVGVKYEKDALNGSPILPLFRLDGSNPKVDPTEDAPPFDPNGPIWKLDTQRRIGL